MSENDTAVPTRQSIRRWRRLPVPLRKVMVRSRRLSHLTRPAHPHVTVQLLCEVALITFDDGKVNVISRQSTPLLADAHERVMSNRIGEGSRAGRPPRPVLRRIRSRHPGDRRCDRNELFRTAWDMLS
jgi:hypothetical protein